MDESSYILYGWEERTEWMRDEDCGGEGKLACLNVSELQMSNFNCARI